MKKRVLTALLAAAMILSLAACSGEPINDTPVKPDVPQSTAPNETDKQKPEPPMTLEKDPEPDEPETPEAPDEPETPEAPDGPEIDIPSESASQDEKAFVDQIDLDPDANIEDEAVALAAGPVAIPAVLSPTHPGTAAQVNGKASIDYSNVADGYVMACFTAATSQKLKCQVAGPGTTYTYNLTPGEWETFPLSDGNGGYKITVYENTTGSKYATVLSASTNVNLKDEFEPFIRPNQYVDYESAPNTIATAAGLIGNETDVLKKVGIVYEYVVTNLTYDKAKAASVQSGYLPVLDDVLAKKTGICFDYAALMAGMLRSQGVPCKLVVGYAGTAYHAWISVWSAETGWVENAIYFDGTSWQRMDPTFASSGKQSESIMKYIGDGSNYTAKYFY